MPGPTPGRQVADGGMWDASPGQSTRSSPRLPPSSMSTAPSWRRPRRSCSPASCGGWARSSVRSSLSPRTTASAQARPARLRQARRLRPAEHHPDSRRRPRADRLRELQGLREAEALRGVVEHFNDLLSSGDGRRARLVVAGDRHQPAGFLGCTDTLTTLSGYDGARRLGGPLLRRGEALLGDPLGRGQRPRPGRRRRLRRQLERRKPCSAPRRSSGRRPPAPDASGCLALRWTVVNPRRPHPRPVRARSDLSYSPALEPAGVLRPGSFRGTMPERGRDSRLPNP